MPDGRIYRRRKCKTCKQKTQNVRRRKIAAAIQDYKRSQHCGRCGFADYRALQFHHEGNKSFNVSEGSTRSLNAVMREIKKCVVLCANCHAIEHHTENW